MHQILLLAIESKIKTKSNTAIVPIEKWREIDIYDSYENQFLTFWKKFHKQIIDEYKNEQKI